MIRYIDLKQITYECCIKKNQDALPKSIIP
jgi:hypothetical protein